MAPEHIARNSSGDVAMRDAPDATPIASPKPNDQSGPNPGSLKVSHQYLLEQRIRRKLDRRGADPAREAKFRLEGIQLIDSIREKLQLPAKTYNAACTFYHKLRLKHPNYELNNTDVAMACLFTACKVEDTHKKSRDIACARWNLQNPDNQLTQDDKTFDAPSKAMLNLERAVLEALRFDFRVRFPQKIIAKLVKYRLGSDEQAAKDFFAVAYAMSFDMYKTHVPIKHTTFSMSLAVVELTALLTGVHIDEFRIKDPSIKWHTDRSVVLECLLDLLDLYTLYPKATRVGLMFDLEAFIDIKIAANKELEERSSPRYQHQCEECAQAGVPPSPSTGSEKEDERGDASTASNNNNHNNNRAAEVKRSRDGTTRFVFDVDAAYRERDVVKQFTEDHWEEHEVEVEETIPEDIPDRPRGPRAAPRGPRGRGGPPSAFNGGGMGRGGRPDFDPGWTPRNRHDRPRGGPRGGMGGRGGGQGYY
ncbi:uncharacterized protein B0I36DRAFT_323807 [Microdochium trichocladiopsis]|uniref:RNA polymerase II holoenzyme cyclin-like subunit n=1 Tax=Microdochium trichocladiopsis TaxID=1682393 RepID=A0A9P8Y7I6_9PEZI|nr:uncharacterized protein B0I36DRAFT_323807 [Microdochium trichocladiopsis]KAH7031377.1 hypothetical protein B0I36DRAFT_323807 [Microdochium trichocladiopsis]